MDALTERVVRELGLEELRGLEPEAFKEAVRLRGRKLLGRYHPDRNPGNSGAAVLFRRVGEVLQKVADWQPEPAPRVRVTLYAEQFPSGSYVRTRTSYFPGRTQTVSSGIRYDARRVIFVKP